MIGAGAVLCAASDAAYCQADHEVLIPKRIKSPSGEYVLQYQPSDKLGGGSARYRVSKDGKDLWRDEKPLSLWDIVVTDDGKVCGYAYPQGLYGLGEFHLVVLGTDGKYLVNDTIARKRHEYLPALTRPMGSGILHDTMGKRVVFRITEAKAEAWWVYDLADGESVAKFYPRELLQTGDQCGYVIDAASIPGTPLALVHWAGCATGPPATGLAVFELDGNVTWVREVPHPTFWADWVDYKGRPATWADILPMTDAGRFVVRMNPEKKDMAYRVTRDASGVWQVRGDGPGKGESKDKKG